MTAGVARKHPNPLAGPVQYLIKHYGLEQGALEIAYIEEFFPEFPRRKTAEEIVGRLSGREHLILMAEAPLPDDPAQVVPVAYKVSHRIYPEEPDPKLHDLVHRLRGCVAFEDRKVLYSWIGGTRSDWRGRGFFRALSEEQETWAVSAGFDEILVKTKNNRYGMRGTLDHLRYDIVKFEANSADVPEAKVYLSKRLGADVLDAHRSARTVVQVG
jgi:GNAT superfamily N-acetyltransferase